MDKELMKVLDKANKELKQQKIFGNYQIRIDGDFTTEYNGVELVYEHRTFPIANAATTGEAKIIIEAYICGLQHGEDKSYPKWCDKNKC